MKTKKVFSGISITALILTIILISLQAYYVAIALIAGTLIIGYRELWSLISRRKLPPTDERVRENAGKSVRNGFIFFTITSAFLMLFFTINQNMKPDMVHVLGGLLLSGGMVYLLSYLFYDHVEPKLDERRQRMLKTFLMVTGISLGAFIISAFLHNAMSGLFGIEEPVFFSIAVFISPLAFAIGLIGILEVLITGLFNRAS